VAEGRELDGIHFAMEFLPLQNRVNSGQISTSSNPINAEGKKVLVIGAVIQVLTALVLQSDRKL